MKNIVIVTSSVCMGLILISGCLDSHDSGSSRGRLRISFAEETEYYEAISLVNSYNVSIIESYNTTTSYDFGDINHLIVIAVVNDINNLDYIVTELNNSNLTIKCSITTTDG